MKPVPSNGSPDSPPRRELLGHRVGAGLLATAVVLVLVRFSSGEQIADGAAYLFNDRRWQTLLVLLAMALAISVGILLLRTARDVEPNSRRRRIVRTGRLLIWATIPTPLLIGLVWWAFFSAGDA